MSRKIRSDAVLSNLPLELQEQIIAWCDTPKSRGVEGGQRYALRQLAERGIVTSPGPLSTFYQTSQLRQDLLVAQEVEQVMKKVGSGGAKKARQAAENMLLHLSISRQDPKLFDSATRSIDNGRRLDLREDVVRLAEKKYFRDSCEVFIHWHEDETAKQIAAGPGSHEEKIHALGRHLFGEAWDQ